MKKSLVMLLALTGTALVSCTQTEFVGEAVQQSENEAIVFGGGTSKLTRADGFIENGDAATLLNNEMKVYGVKQDATTTTNYNKVFVDYTVSYDNSKNGNTEFNNGWYYETTGQTVKYWDYASADYHFVAGSPVSAFTYALNATTGDIESATVTGFGGRLNHSVTVASDADPVYIADPVVVAKANYKQPVKFTFRSSQAKVRVGIYETIDGYKITDIKFYNNDATPVASNYITLNSATADYFQGGSATATITYDWTTPKYTFAYGSGLTTGKYWEGGKFADGVKAVKSMGADIDDLYGVETSKDGTTGYFVVMPTPSATTAAPLTLTCDYTLTSIDGSGETINVKGAKATIPAEWTKWVANTAYTYLFKITKDTNGTSGTEGTDPEGLFPITFDAVIVDITDAAQEVGTETTLATPSITVYQEGNVVEDGLKFVAGKAVTVKVMSGTTDVTSSATLTWTKYTGTESIYAKDFEKLGASGAATVWGAAPATVEAGTYVIKAQVTIDSKDYTTYFVLVVDAAEEGPANS